MTPLPNLYSQPLRKCLLTAEIGQDAEAMGRITLPPLARYAGHHGYELRVRREAYDDRPLQWTKVPMLREHLFVYDILLWVDIDVLVIREEYDIGEILAHTLAFQGLAVEGRYPNTGVWAVRGSDPLAASFLAAVDAQADLYGPHDWPGAGLAQHEQAAVKRLLGYMGKPVENPDWPLGTVLLPPEVNDLTRLRPEAVVHHHAGFGRPIGERLAELRQDARR